MKITLSAAMRARDASRPQAEHEAAARAADLAAKAPADPPGQQRPAPGNKEADGGGPGATQAGGPQPGSGRRGGAQRGGRGRGRSRRRQG